MIDKLNESNPDIVHMLNKDFRAAVTNLDYEPLVGIGEKLLNSEFA